VRWIPCFASIHTFQIDGLIFAKFACKGVLPVTEPCPATSSCILAIAVSVTSSNALLMSSIRPPYPSSSTRFNFGTVVPFHKRFNFQSTLLSSYENPHCLTPYSTNAVHVRGQFKARCSSWVRQYITPGRYGFPICSSVLLSYHPRIS
jgi:hypothetical protein